MGAVQVQGLTSGVTAISIGSEHSCAVVNGAAFCWGYGESGEIGNNAQNISNLVPVQVQGLTSGVTAIAAGVCSDHTCALVNGGVQCWGLHDGGPGGSYRLVPQAVQFQ